MIPTFGDCESAKNYINNRVRQIFVAAGSPADFTFDVVSVEPAADDPWTAKITVLAGAETFAVHFAIVGAFPVEGLLH